MQDLESTVKNFCSENNLRLNTDLGQHFLIDNEVLQSIVNAAQLESDDIVIEIGPGIGILTCELLKHARKVTAIEIDNRMIPLIKKFVDYSLQTTHYSLEIIQDNALNTPFPSKPYKVVANIPYHITSPLLRHAFLESKATPKTMTLLIQREVAEKICSKTDSGMLTILVHLFGSPRIITHVPPSSFLPPPKVQSSILHIDCFDEPKAEPKVIEEIFRLTKIAFGKKRKMISNSIGELDGGMELLEKAGIDPDRRPQTISIDEWKSLAQKSMK